MAVTLKFLSQAAAKAQQVIAASPRIIGEATPKTPKTPVSSPGRFSPMFEEFEHSAKQVLSGSPSKLASLPLVPELPVGPRSLDFDKAQKTGGMPLFQQQQQQQQQERWQKLALSLFSANDARGDSPEEPLKKQQQQQQQELDVQLQREGSSLIAAALQRAAASTAGQQELATSAVPAAQLAQQSFLSRRNHLGVGACDQAGSVVGATPEGVYSVGVVAQRVSLLGRGEDAAAFPAFDTVPPKLPVLLGQGPCGARQVANWDAASNKDIAEHVREAFLARQGRITGRSVARKVP